MDKASFFSDFSPVSKSAWLAEVEKSLKGKKSLDDLVWSAEKELDVTPFVHAEDFKDAPIPQDAAPIAWEISETMQVGGDAGALNAQVLDALSYGAEGLEFHFQAVPTFEQLEQVLNGVHLDYIGLHFSGATGDPLELLGFLSELATKHEVDPKALWGSIHPNTKPGWELAHAGIIRAKEQLPGFRTLPVQINPSESAGTVDELVALLKAGHTCIENLQALGSAPGEVAAQLHFNISIGEQYFLEMARLRAFRLLWLHVLRGWDAPLAYPYISVSFKERAYTDDLYTNMIRSTTMAMSGVLGGANRLTVLPYDAGREAQAQYSQTFSRRIARNVQHLLKMESRMEEAIDPIAGSYYLETLVRQLCEQAWERFGKEI